MFKFIKSFAVTMILAFLALCLFFSCVISRNEDAKLNNCCNHYFTLLSEPRQVKGNILKGFAVIEKKEKYEPDDLVMYEAYTGIREFGVVDERVETESYLIGSYEDKYILAKDIVGKIVYSSETCVPVAEYIISISKFVYVFAMIIIILSAFVRIKKKVPLE